jgi:uncharacterized protein (DUF2252 family)
MATEAHAPQAADPNRHSVPRRPTWGVTAAEQRALGRAARKDVPRSELASWAEPADRPDPVALLEEQAQTRLPDLVPIRYGRMLVSPFTFYRGAALVMAADLARMPSSGIYTWLCGDAHLSNFGVFATPERRLVFDLNDFDEAFPGPFEWDVKRLAASVFVAARDNGLSDDQAQAATTAAVGRYRETILAVAGQSALDAWYTRIDVADVVRQIEATHDKRDTRAARKFVRKASTRTNLGSLSKFAYQTADGQWRIRETKPLIIGIDPGELTDGGRLVAEVLADSYAQYAASLRTDLRVLISNYRFADIARKVVGVGSVGTAAFMVLLLGPHDDPLFLQLKEAVPSVLERYTEPSLFGQNGERVVVGQRLMQAASDQFLGWLRVDAMKRPYDFYARQLRDWKGSVDIDALPAEGLARYAGACGVALAHAHARGGSASAIAGYVGKGRAFDTAISRFAAAYADQTALDHAALADAEAGGRIEVEHGL